MSDSQPSSVTLILEGYRAWLDELERSVCSVEYLIDRLGRQCGRVVESFSKTSAALCISSIASLGTLRTSIVAETNRKSKFVINLMDTQWHEVDAAEKSLAALGRMAFSEVAWPDGTLWELIRDLPLVIPLLRIDVLPRLSSMITVSDGPTVVASVLRSASRLTTHIPGVSFSGSGSMWCKLGASDAGLDQNTVTATLVDAEGGHLQDSSCACLEASDFTASVSVGGVACGRTVSMHLVGTNTLELRYTMDKDVPAQEPRAALSLMLCGSAVGSPASIPVRLLTCSCNSDIECCICLCL